MLSLTARGLTTGEVAAHFAEVYGATVSKDTISRITDKVAWGDDRVVQPAAGRGLFPVMFIDAIHVKVRDGQVTNRAFYLAVGVTVDGHRDIPDMWAGDGAEGGKYWLSVLTELTNRGVADVCIVVCDGLKGLPEAITTVWPQALVQACVLHLIPTCAVRRSFSERRWETFVAGPSQWAGGSWRQPDSGSAEEGGSSRDKAGSCQDRQMVRARRAR